MVLCYLYFTSIKNEKLKRKIKLRKESQVFKAFPVHSHYSGLFLSYKWGNWDANTTLGAKCSWQDCREKQAAQVILLSLCRPLFGQARSPLGRRTAPKTGENLRAPEKADALQKVSTYDHLCTEHPCLRTVWCFKPWLVLKNQSTGVQPEKTYYRTVRPEAGRDSGTQPVISNLMQNQGSRCLCPLVFMVSVSDMVADGCQWEIRSTFTLCYLFSPAGSEKYSP